MPPENNTGAPLPDVSQLNTPGGAPTVGSVPTPSGAQAAIAVEVLTLAEINEQLGKQFPTKESAIKAFKDTFSYVGKKKEDIEKEVRANIQQDDRVSKLEKDLAAERKERFFDRNPQYAEPTVRKLIEKIGGEPTDVVNTEEFKQVFEKMSGYDKTQKLKTVLESNPRLVASRDSLAKARDAQQKSGGVVTHEVQAHAVDAVMDAFDLKK